MSLTPDPYLLRLHRVDASELEDNRVVQVAGEPEQIRRHLHDLATEPMESAPQPHRCAALINWLIVVGCAIALAVVSVPQLRDAIVQVLR